MFLKKTGQISIFLANFLNVWGFWLAAQLIQPIRSPPNLKKKFTKKAKIWFDEFFLIYLNFNNPSVIFFFKPGSARYFCNFFCIFQNFILFTVNILRFVEFFNMYIQIIYFTNSVFFKYFISFFPETWHYLAPLINQANSILWHWKTFPISLPSPIETKIEPEHGTVYK